MKSGQSVSCATELTLKLQQHVTVAEKYPQIRIITYQRTSDTIFH